MSSVTAPKNSPEQLPSRIVLDPMPENQLPLSSIKPPLRPRKDRGSARLSFAQERLWLLDQINPGNVSANVSGAVRIRGPLDTEALKAAAQALLDRHESLRTTFAQNQLRAGVDSQPLQLIAQRGVVDLNVIDFSHLKEGERAQRARVAAREEAQCTFDLTLGPLWRLTLLKLSDRDWVASFNAHRIICDEGSIQIFFDELWEIYQSVLSGGRTPLGPLPVQYADYAAWQRDWLQNEALKSQLDYWHRKLEGAPAAIELPFDQPRPPVQSWHGASAGMVLVEGLMGQLKELAACQDATLFMVLMAAFQVLLSRYSRQTDIVVGSRFANRDVEETRGLIGPIASSLVFRTDLSGNPTFRELLERVRASALEAQAHQSIPFEKLIEELKVERSLSHAPVFQVMLNLSSARETTLDAASLHVEPFAFETGIAPLDLTLNSLEDGERLHCRLEYNSDVFDVATISRMLSHWSTLLCGIVENPGERISRLPLLTAPERQQLLTEWNDVRVDYRTQQCVHQLFETQAEKAPDPVALVFENQPLSYRELNERANQLAHYLRQRAVGPEVLVGVCMERSLELVVALLAILKAGGAYVPLDPAYPEDRLQFMMDDADVAVLLTQQRLREIVADHRAEVVEVDTDWPRIAAESKANPTSSVTQDNLAYVIYTSGSTGRPKGAMNTHRGLSNRLLWMQEAYGLTATDAVLQKTPFSFDVSVWEFFWPLITGARLVVARPGGHQDSAYLVNAIRQNRITTLHFVPSMLQVFLEQTNVEQCESVRQLICSGEALSFELQERSLARLKAKLYNLYGPTEASIDVTQWECRQGDARKGVPIGRPIANTQIYLLDAYLQPVPIGVAGELFIGGVGLGRAYLKRPNLTAERFIPNPFSDEPGTRLYRTGDLARYRDDGAIDFLGRIDDQVKVRGFRIELGEIESVLAQHESVSECAVLAEEHLGGKRLVAYVVASQRDGSREPENLASSLRGFLLQQLPEYMVPALFTSLDALPLLPNGKLDRRALPKPDDSRPNLEVAFAAARDRLEAQLVRLWGQVLGLKSVGIRDNFFELGGQSLLAARLFAQIENHFGKNLPLATLFHSPTIEQLAVVLRENISADAWSPLVPIQPNGSKPPLYCVHACGPHVFIYRPLARRLSPDQPVYGLQAQGLDGKREPFQKISDMAAHYIKEIRDFQPHGPYHLLGDTLAGLFALEMAQQLVEQGEEVGLLAMIDTFCPLRPSLGRRLACHLIHLKELGVGSYVFAGARAAKNRLARKVTKDVANPYAQTKEVEAARQASDTDDPLVKTEWAIYKAAYLNYSPPTKVFPGRIVYFLAADAAYASRYEDNRLTWKKMAGKGFEVHQIPGRHDTVKEEPNVAILAEKLTACLERAEKEKGKAKAK